MTWILYIYVFLFSWAVGHFLVPIVRQLALKWHFVDKPDKRKSHAAQQPLLGGLAIYLAIAVTVAVQFAGFFVLKDSIWLTGMFPKLQAQLPYLSSALPKLLAIAAGSTIMLVLGTVDDRVGTVFPYQLKFLVQFIAASLLIAFGVRISFMPNEALNMLVTLVWVVGMTNAFNLLDNMDGLSAGVAFISALMFMLVTAVQVQFFSAMLFCTIAGACSGFLRYNFHPARIFMGDGGSLFLGYLLAALSITASYVVPESQSLLPASVPLLVLSLPIFDTLSVISIRINEHRPLFQGDRRHFSHRLVDLGMTPRGAVIFIYVVSATVGVAAVLMPYLPIWGECLILIQTALLYTMISIIVHIAKRQGNDANSGNLAGEAMREQQTMEAGI